MTSRRRTAAVDPEASGSPSNAKGPRPDVTHPQHQHQRVKIVDPYLVILASAGTGKTFQLTSRYLMLLRLGGPERILASTFTRKAAHEIFNRVLVRLAAAVLRDADLRGLQQHVGAPPITREECVEILDVVTRQMHRVQIGTLDSLFSRLASSHTLELGFPPGWRLADPVTVERIKHRAIENVLRRAGRQDARRLMHLLSKGESTRRVHDLIDETVTNFLQAYQLTEREAWEQIPESPLLDPVSLSAAILSLETMRFDDSRFQSALKKSIEQLERGAWDEFLLSTFPQRILNGDLTYYRKELPADLVGNLRPLMEHAVGWVRKTWAEQTRGTWETVDRVAREMDRIKTEDRVYEFGDVTHRLAERLAAHEVRNVGFRLDATPDHLLLDEFQDTSLDQWEILRPFAESATSHPANSLFVVGDRKQAIYGWRGGEAAIFDTIRSEFPILQSRQLDESRRSAPAIIDAVNKAFLSLRDTNAFEQLSTVISDWCREFPEHSTARHALPGYVCMEVSADPSIAAGARTTKSDRTDVVFERTADWIADAVSRTPAATIGVLFRRNAAIRKLAAMLRQRGIEYSEEGGTLITDSAAVQLLISLMKIADHPGDRIARFHVGRSPLAEVHAFTDWEDDRAAAALSVHLRSRLLQDGYVVCLQRWSQQLGSSVSDHDRARLRQLLELAEVHQPTTRVSDFVRLVETQHVENPSTSPVQLMTVHKSKGLQFDLVFLPELEIPLAGTPKVLLAKSSEAKAADRVLVYKTRDLRQVLPEELQAAYDQTRAREVNEAMCLLYVALTRAIHALHIVLPFDKSMRGKETLAGVLLEGLGSGTAANPGSVLYEVGDPRWYDHCPGLTRRPDADLKRQEKSLYPPRVDFAPLEGGRRRGLDRIRPSQIAEKTAGIKLSGILKLRESLGADRGTLFHAWFERISWLDEKRPSESDLRQIADRLGTDGLNIDRCLSQFQALLRQPQVAATLSKCTYQLPSNLPYSAGLQNELSTESYEVGLERERRFAVQIDGQMVTGAIDRLILLRRHGVVIAADIVDFKTDALSDEAGEESGTVTSTEGGSNFSSPHADQMKSYAKAVGQIYRLPLERISARLLMLAAGQLRVVEF